MTRQAERIPHEQFVYAQWLDWCTRIALLLLVATFVAYVLEFTTPHVPFDQLTRLWSLPGEQYRAAASRRPAGDGALASHKRLHELHRHRVSGTDSDRLLPPACRCSSPAGPGLPCRVVR